MKKLLIALTLMFAAIGVKAQTAIETPKTFDNVYVGGQVGVTTPMSFNSFFPLNFNLGVKVGKDLTPVVGFNIEDNIWFGSASDGGSRFSYKNGVRANDLGVNLTINTFNWFGGYNPNRVFTIIPEVGLGWLHSFNSNAKDFNDLSAKTGVQFAFNVGEKKAWQIYAEPVIWWNLTKTAQTQFNKNHSQLGLQAGVIYKFKNSNKTHNFVVWDIDALNNEINNLREELSIKPKVMVQIDTVKVPEVREVVTIIRDGFVPFAQDSYEIEEFEYLNSIPEGTVVTLTGYASPEGKKEYNQTLSENRANEVAAYLKERGVIVKEAKGLGTNSNYSNRVVVITTQE